MPINHAYCKQIKILSFYVHCIIIVFDMVLLPAEISSTFTVDVRICLMWSTTV